VRAYNGTGWGEQKWRKTDFPEMNHILETIENKHRVTMEVAQGLSIGTNFDDLE